MVWWMWVGMVWKCSDGMLDVGFVIDGEDIVVGSDGYGVVGVDWGSGGDDEDNEVGCGR